MTEDYLIEEFHEAGIYLPEELEAIETVLRRLERMRAVRTGVQVVPAKQWRIVQGVYLPPAAFNGIGYRQKAGPLDGIGAIIGGIFGAL